MALVIPHQANYRIINEARRRIPDIAPEKFCINIDRYGNTSSASVPILLDEMNRAGKIHEATSSFWRHSAAVFLQAP